MANLATSMPSRPPSAPLPATPTKTRALHLRGGSDSPPGYSSDEAAPDYDYTSAESSDSDDPSSSSVADDDANDDYEYDERDHTL
jgi:hypothetical protein